MNFISFFFLAQHLQTTSEWRSAKFYKGKAHPLDLKAIHVCTNIYIHKQSQYATDHQHFGTVIGQTGPSCLLVVLKGAVLLNGLFSTFITS